MDRRHFMAWAAVAGAGSFDRAARALLSSAARATVGGAQPRAPYQAPAVIAPDGATLVARSHSVEIAPGVRSEVWSVGDGPVGPTIRARTGDTARLILRNELAEPTILHWHGLRVPERADGHPRLAIGTGGSYQYDFPITDRAGTYWYHAHPHERTAPQVYLGMAGFFLISDADEDALGLPGGAREIPLLIHDRRSDETGQIRYDIVMREQMEGFFGDTPFGNGIRLPALKVDTALYRFRLLNGTNSRIIRLGLSNRQSMLLIGGDAGLLPAPVTVSSVDLGTGERADLLVDFSRLRPGERITLESMAFPSPSTMGGMGGMRGMGRGAMAARGLPQGAALALLDLEVTRMVREAPWKPRPFPVVPRLAEVDADRSRTFRFASMMMSHTINGRTFALDRIDETVRFGDTEVWSFVNDGPFPHPVHLHEAHFQVLRRVGGRGRIMPWESGWKDTVLVHPGERVDVIMTFDRNRGRFLMHCHNLVHEDMGMMLNFEIV